jgi:hypothetical protein
MREIIMDNPENNLKTLWQDQPTEPTAMSLEAVQQRAAKLQARLYRSKLLVYGLVALAVPLYFFATVTSPNRIMTSGYLLTLLGILFVFSFYRQHAQVDRKAVSAASHACVDFHKQALVRWRNLTRTAWAWGLLPVLPGALLMFYGAHQIVGYLPPHTRLRYGIDPQVYIGVLYTLGVLGVVGHLIRTQWKARKYDKELKDLEAGQLS